MLELAENIKTLIITILHVQKNRQIANKRAN